MSPGEIRRPDLEGRLALRAEGAPPLLLAGPPGSGKTTLLLDLAASLARAGAVPIYLDLMGAASSPERLIAAALDVLPAEHFGSRLGRALQIRRLADGGRARGAEAVGELFALWASLNQAGERPVALLLDEVTEIRSLAYFEGLREAGRMLGASLAKRRGGTILATSFPTRALETWPELERLDARPFTAEELAGAARRHGVDPELLWRASFGWPRYLDPLIEGGPDLEAAWVREMAPGGRLEGLARHTYESLLLRSRGYGMSKAVLAAVAQEEGLNLTALVARLGRTPGAVRDYLRWLVGVDALRVARKRYFYVDGMVRLWVRLHARGTPPTEAQLVEAARDLLARPPAGEATGAPEPEPVVSRHDSLMEID